MTTGHIILIILGVLAGLAAGASLLIWGFGALVDAMWGKKRAK